MRRRIAHRGPDDAGVVVDDGMGLGHVRLAILDPSPHAAQPMTSRCGRFVIAYNGEIFNFSDLGQRLAAAGRRVSSSGDTEVLVESIARFGLGEVLPELEGFFALTLWDRARKEITLVRDRHGIKPLYYKRCGPELRFASETKALLGPSPEIDPVTLNAMLLGQGCTWGPNTLYRDIRRVEPGEAIVFTADGVKMSYRVLSPLDYVDGDRHEALSICTDEQLVDEVEAALVESVELRLKSDAPVACLASGGLDSSLIAAVAARQTDSLSLYHADVDHDSEREHAEHLASVLGLELHAEPVSDRVFLDHVVHATWHNDAPIMYHPNAVPLYLVSRRASADGIKVVLTGEGSDEYFLGYPHVALKPWVDRYRGTVDGLQRLVHRLLPRAATILCPRRSAGRAELIRRLTRRGDAHDASVRTADSLGHLADPRERDGAALALDLVHRHLTTLLHRNDRLAMAWGIESRFPFLGHRLASIAVNLPYRARIRHAWTVHNPRHPFVVDKWCIRKVAERYLPESLWRRPKKGFPVSVSWRMHVDGRLFDGGFIADFYGLPRSVLRDLVSDPTTDWAVQLLYAEIWARLFVRGHSIDEVRDHVLRHVSVSPESGPWLAAAA
jgi:asparagine synthase (glutamine-hydrolysing)